jgi:hypothetical protein
LDTPVPLLKAGSYEVPGGQTIRRIFVPIWHLQGHFGRVCTLMDL